MRALAYLSELAKLICDHRESVFDDVERDQTDTQRPKEMNEKVYAKYSEMISSVAGADSYSEATSWELKFTCRSGNGLKHRLPRVHRKGIYFAQTIQTARTVSEGRTTHQRRITKVRDKEELGRSRV